MRRCSRLTHRAGGGFFLRFVVGGEFVGAHHLNEQIIDEERTVMRLQRIDTRRCALISIALIAALTLPACGPGQPADISPENADRVEELRVLESGGEEDEASSAAWSVDGKTLAVGFSTSKVILWDTESWDVIDELIADEGVVQDLAWSPDGQMLAGGYKAGVVELWDVESRELVEVIGEPFDTEAFLDSATSGAGGDVMDQLIALGAAFEELKAKLLILSVKSVSWAPTGLDVAFAANFVTWRWNDELKGDTPAFGEPRESLVLSCAWSPDGSTMAAAYMDGVIKLWDVESDEEKATHEADGAVESIAWSPDGGMLAFGTDEGAVRLWHIETGETTLLGEHADGVSVVTWAPNGTIVASAGADMIVHLWDVESGEEISQLSGHEVAINDLDWSPDGKMLVSVGGAEQSIRVWGLP
jgi:WD40 repeat protein